ncbi:MAG: type II secretion system F family protein [Candidatus Omnitrophota bacterium]|nr:type II secretion system F family protein [Candidatus Omnitrophota bacterium]
MPIYNYKVRDEKGGIISSTLEYDSEEKLSAGLEKIGLYVISITDITGRSSKLLKIVDRFRGISNLDLIIFTRQVSIMLKSGLTLLDSLTGVFKQTRHKKLKAVIKDVVERIRSGSSFSQAIQAHSSIFGEMYINMVRAGETSGILDNIMERLSALATHEAEIKNKIRAAVTYPAVIISMAVLIVFFLLTFVMPKFINIFETAGTQLPLPTKILLGISSVLRYRWYVILALLAGTAIGFYRWVKTEKGRYKFDRFKLSLPVIGALYLRVLISRFTRLLGLLVKSGIPLLYSIEVVGRTVDNSVLFRIIAGSRKGITEGQSLSETLQLSGIFPPMVIQMIGAGENTGKLEEMLTEVSDFYDVEIEYGIRNLTSLIEPAMIIIMGLIVGFIALSVLLPIFNLVKLFK